MRLTVVTVVIKHLVMDSDKSGLVLHPEEDELPYSITTDNSELSKEMMRHRIAERGYLSMTDSADSGDVSDGFHE